MPYKTFSSSENKVYEYFCNLAYGNKRTLKWNFDSKGTLKRTVALKEKARRSENGPRMRIDKRTPPANPDSYSSFNFELIWEPMNNIDRDKCLHTCEEAYEALATSPCGHVGGKSTSENPFLSCSALTPSVLSLGFGWLIRTLIQLKEITWHYKVASMSAVVPFHTSFPVPTYQKRLLHQPNHHPLPCHLPPLPQHPAQHAVSGMFHRFIRSS